jgi:hypothetical protein
MFDRRITVFCGHYGSGKTEISISTALNLRQRYDRVTIVDLDIVNPYFRSAEHEDLFAQHDIALLAPTFANTTVDIPGLPAQIQSVFADRRARVVFDVGGDDTGAVALGRYKPYFDQDDYEMIFVVNVLRPFSGNVADIVDLYGRICNRARMQASALINNTNCGPDTTVEQIVRGHAVLEEAGKALGLPVRAVVAREDLVNKLPPALARIAAPLTIRTRPEWMS